MFRESTKYVFCDIFKYIFNIIRWFSIDYILDFFSYKVNGKAVVLPNKGGSCLQAYIGDLFTGNPIQLLEVTSSIGQVPHKYPSMMSEIVSLFRPNCRRST